MHRSLKNQIDPNSYTHTNQREVKLKQPNEKKQRSALKPFLSNEIGLESKRMLHQRPITVPNSDGRLHSQQLVSLPSEANRRLNKSHRLLPLRRSLADSGHLNQQAATERKVQRLAKSQQIKHHMELFFRKKDRAKIYSRWSPTSIESLSAMQPDRSTLMKNPYAISTLSPSFDSAGDNVQKVRHTFHTRHSSYQLVPKNVQKTRTSLSSHSLRKKSAIEKLINSAIVQSCRLVAEKDSPTSSSKISTLALDRRLNENSGKTNQRQSKSRIDSRWSFDESADHRHERPATNNQRGDQQHTAAIGYFF